MIDYIKLLNFKCFSQATIKMNQLTVLTGANASGKSTVIQALILADPTNRLGKNVGRSWNDVWICRWCSQCVGFPKPGR